MAGGPCGAEGGGLLGDEGALLDEAALRSHQPVRSQPPLLLRPQQSILHECPLLLGLLLGLQLGLLGFRRRQHRGRR
jgi:hypothetical protein